MNYLVILLSFLAISGNGLPMDSERIEEVDGNRIVGGVDAKDGQVPYQALVLSSAGSVCGGAIISTRWIITAAHCVVGKGSYRACVGSNLYNAGTIYAAKVVTYHENYNPNTLQNDIALMKTATAMLFSAYVKAANLPNTILGAGVKLTVSGWGQLSGTQGLAKVLQVTWVSTLSTDECAARKTPVTPGKMCTMAYNGGGTCMGDSGGPFVTISGNTYILHGITSYGISNKCEPNQPNVETRVSYYVDWIDNTMRKYRNV